MNSRRLISLDALRGFTMFWIIGGDALIHSLANSTGWAFFEWCSTQLTHAVWNGFHFYDLIFPLFMFISGVAIPFSLGKKIKKGVPKRTLLISVMRRALILIFFGIVYNNEFSFDFLNLRYASVLGQIGVAYFFASVIFLYSNIWKQAVWLISILLGFWALMVLVPVPGFGAGILTPEGNLSGYIDRLLLPGTFYREYYDPQGILLMFSAIAITLTGVLTGAFLKNEKYSGIKKCITMFLAGISLVLLSLVWNIWYPINKEIWSSSFNLLTGGLSLILLSIFYLIVDVKGATKWAFPLVVIGLNPITIYMASRMVNFKYTANYFLSGVMDLTGEFELVVLNIGIITLEGLLLYFLYKRKIFLKV